MALAHPESLSMTRSMGHDINTEKQVRLEPLKSRIEDATRVGRGCLISTGDAACSGIQLTSHRCVAASSPYALAPNPSQKQTNKIVCRSPRTEMALSVSGSTPTIRICLDASSDECIGCCNADMPARYFSSRTHPNP